MVLDDFFLLEGAGVPANGMVDGVYPFLPLEGEEKKPHSLAITFTPGVTFPLTTAKSIYILSNSH